ncbi:SDR family NAD(P)-dependent oxidoreductase [Paraburkholderia lycopersici]|uniref:NAD(P)-dependent dehydrogenase, short-chain alcohol dehydrogenase family n=1 Tax=Paraburkholderia lycopersici TaxID=416944 RepID=A0A1G7B4N6_9BURK|nr:SDR family oxidoreductase [Paraburkholderia lycopersici]SDE22098.1 NAD(P)-dependent dehydrogenase, short-chain alcohol dehydrogenase family [Paraburkholderia lycopersici]
MDRLKGKVAIVTGASSGFGRGIAMAYAAQGAKVVVSDIHEEPNKGGFERDAQLTTAAAIRKAGGEATYVQCDVTKQGDVANLVQETARVYGGLDVIVNNAGVYRAGKLAHEFGVEDLDTCFAVNVKGMWFGCQEAIKLFLRQGRGGNIVNIVSTAGLQGHPRQSVYNISKGAAANLTRCLAIEYGREKIRVNGICPTYAKTSLTRALFDDKDFDKAFTDVIPLKRWGEVEDIANLAIFLGSDESSYIHGDLIRIDGGETLCRFSV